MRVVLLAGGGFISSAVERRLLADGHKLTLLNRSGRAADPRTQVVQGDRHDLATLKDLAATGCDAVIDFRCFSAEDATQVVTGFGGAHVTSIMISTGSVYWCTGHWTNPVSEDQFGPQHAADTPEQPATAFSPGSIEYDYGLGKRRAEKVLEASDGSGTLKSIRLRLPIVAGPADPTGRYAGYVQRLLADQPIILPDGGFNSFRHVWVDDVAAAVAAALAGPSARGAYNVCSETITSVRDVIAGLAAALHRPLPELVAIPGDWLVTRSAEPVFAPFSRSRDQILDLSRAARELGFSPTPWKDGVARMVKGLTSPAAVTEAPAVLAREAELVQRYRARLG